VFARPTINDFYDLIRWHLGKASERASLGVQKVRREFSAAGALDSGRSVIYTFQAARQEFDGGVEAVLGELKRVKRSTKLDSNDLRQAAIGELTNFAMAIKAIAKTPEASGTMEKFVAEQGQAIDQHLQFAVRQFDIGFFNPTEPEVPPVTNNITVGSMTGSAIQQGSPNAKQTVEFKLDVHTLQKAVADFESALAGAALPKSKLDEILADTGTIRAQLAKPTPSHLIVQEAGKSLRNVIEGVAGGMLTPTVVAAAAALWSALGLG
jgi:hypothetical protein